jgi:hypothetical protein
MERKRGPFGPWSGAGNRSRTGDLNLGKVALYQLSYSREERANNAKHGHAVKRPTLKIVHAGGNKFCHDCALTAYNGGS